MAAGNLPDEIEALRKRLLKDPTSRIFLPLAEKYRDNGMLNEAEDVLREGLAHHPDYTGAIFSLARVLHEKGNQNAALEKFREVVRVAPDNLLAHKKRAEIAIDKNLMDEALESLGTVLRLDPSDEKSRALKEKYERFSTKPAKEPSHTETSVGADDPDEFSARHFDATAPAATILESEYLSGPEPMEMPGGPADADLMHELEEAHPSEQVSESGLSFAGLETQVQPDEDIDLSLGGLEPENSGPDLDIFGEEKETIHEDALDHGGDKEPPAPADAVAPGLEETEDTDASLAFGQKTRTITVEYEGPFFELPTPDEIILDAELGIDTPFVLTPVEGQIEPAYGWTEPVSFETPEPDAQERATPAYAIEDDEPEQPTDGQAALLEPDENLRQLFREIAGEDTGPPKDTTPEEEEEIETETMADLYIEQGHYNKALQVYEQLRGRYPDNSNILQKIEEIRFLISIIEQQGRH